MKPITDVSEISRIGYGFIATKVFCATLNLDIYGRLSGHPKTLAQLAEATGVAPNRLLTLLTACVSIGLISSDGERYSNAPASETYLVRGAPAYFGDYFRIQINRQIYPQLEKLDQALAGEDVGQLYDLMHDEAEARQFSHAQHSGSLGPAAALAKRIGLEGCKRLLDVAGGSGAFSIAFCRRNPELRCTIMDFPKVLEVATEYVAEASLSDRIDFISGDAIDTPWPGNQDAVLMSYLFSAVDEGSIGKFFDYAFSVLNPGKHLLVHDFMVDDDRTGPASAALWFIPMLFNPGAVSLTPGSLKELAEAKGFTDVKVADLIPGITQLLTAKKAA